MPLKVTLNSSEYFEGTEKKKEVFTKISSVYGMDDKPLIIPRLPEGEAKVLFVNESLFESILVESE
jgi:hypothetical protein